MPTYKIVIEPAKGSSFSLLGSVFPLIKLVVELVVLILIGYIVYLFFYKEEELTWAERIAEDYWRVYELVMSTPNSSVDLPPFLQAQMNNNCYYQRRDCPRIGTEAQKRMAYQYAEYVGHVNNLPRGFMATMMYIESKANPNAQYTPKGKSFNRYSQRASGWYQYLRSTAKARGVGPVKRFDPYWSADQAAKDALTHQAQINKLGFSITQENMVMLYLFHNQGACGIKKILKMSRDGYINNHCDGYSNRRMYIHLYKNTSRQWKRRVRREGTFTKRSAQAYLDYMQNYLWVEALTNVKPYLGD